MDITKNQWALKETGKGYLVCSLGWEKQLKNTGAVLNVFESGRKYFKYQAKDLPCKPLITGLNSQVRLVL